MILDKPILNDNCNSALAEMWLRSLNELEHDDADISLPSLPSLPEVVTASMATPPGPRPPPSTATLDALQRRAMQDDPALVGELHGQFEEVT